MADDELIRAHDPFSGHGTAPAAEAASEPEKEPEPADPPSEPAKKPPVRRGRRPRRVPTAAEVEGTARKARRR